MAKDTRLINIYLKIHNKKAITLDDLGYLAEHDPECFEKTCKNVVYNIPEAKPVMDLDIPESICQEPGPEPSDGQNRQNIEKILENLKRLEMKEFPVTDIDVGRIKSLLGNLYMELQFPHNDKYMFIDMADSGNVSFLDKRV